MNKFLLSIPLLALSLSSFADTGSSFTLSHHNGDFETQFGDLSPDGVSFKIGGELGTHLDLETELLLGRSGADINDNNKLHLDYGVSIFFKPNVQLDFIKLYGLVGYSYIQAYTQGDGTLGNSRDKNRDSDNDLSYGGGLEITLTPGLALNVEQVKYLTKDEYDYSAVNAGLSFKF